MTASRFAPVIACEHASCDLPARYGRLGLSARVVRSHIGWDPGAGAAARGVVRKLRCAYFEGRYSRLLFDLNRSETPPRVVPRVAFSIAVPGNRDIDATEVRTRIERYWSSHRGAVERCVRARIERARMCLHVGIHSFTSVLNGRTRGCDVGSALRHAAGREMGCFFTEKIVSIT